MSNIYEEMQIHKLKSRREQILTSIEDTRRALDSSPGEETVTYLNNYLCELQKELAELGLN